jgi:hypothetical protein
MAALGPAVGLFVCREIGRLIARRSAAGNDD